MPACMVQYVKGLCLRVKHTHSLTHSLLQPLASGLQIIDVVTTAATGVCCHHTNLILWPLMRMIRCMSVRFLQRKRRMATLESPVLKKARKL